MKTKNYKAIYINIALWEKVEQFNPKLSIGSLAEYLIISGMQYENIKIRGEKARLERLRIQALKDKKFPRVIYLRIKGFFWGKRGAK